ncbi:SLC13 family permease [Lacinutrix chionoecetis]
MDIQILLVFIIIAVTVVMFITEIMPVDKISFIIIVALVLLGLTTPEEAVSGFSNAATITVLMLMIIAIGLEDNGVITLLSNGIKKLNVLPLILMVPVFMLVSAGISSVISTTAVVVIFLKVMSQLSSKFNFSESKLLMPISFAGILGGSCTLMGTSTNLLVNAVAKNRGAEAIGFFEFSLYGLIFLAIGVVFMTIASRWLPKGTERKLNNYNESSEFIFTLSAKEDSEFIGKPFSSLSFYDKSGIKILKLLRDGNVHTAPGKNTTLRAGDEIVLLSDLEDFSLISEEHFELSLKKDNIVVDENDEKNIKTYFIEMLVLPGSEFIGKTLNELKWKLAGDGVPMGIQKSKMLTNKNLYLPKAFNKMHVKSGDRILVKVNEANLGRFYGLENVVVLRSHEDNFEVDNRKKIWCIVTILCVIGLAASGTLSILASSIAGVGALLLGNCINLSKIYKRVNWQIIFLLAGMIPLGIAMSNSGTDTWVSTKLIALLHGQNQMLVLGATFGITMLFSGFISNNATAVIMTPIAIALASGLNLPLKPFIFAVMFGANFSFFTPMGYQTNALIYGTGAYRFKHFLIIGGLLSFILLIAGTLILSTLFKT